MDDATLDPLLRALEATPDNAALIAAVLRARAARGEAPIALALIEGRSPAFFKSPADRALVARILRLAGQADRAVTFVAEAADPEGLLELARARAVRGEQASGLEAYRRAIAGNATLEDPELAALLHARIPRIGLGSDRPALRVIANDDTDRSEIPRLLVPETKKVTFADVGGLDDVKKQIEKRIILPFKKPSLFQRFKKRIGGGILLYGPPGCGKTLLARATAGECNAKFFNVALSDILDMYIGESERKLHAIFEQARQTTPSVLFFDEIEAVAGKRQYTREATSSKIVSALLSELDGFAQNNQGVLVLGATNVPWALDPAVRRPGRFDRVLFVTPPDRVARESILSLLLAGRPTANDIDVPSLAAKTSGFSGADLSNIIETAADFAIEASLEGGSEEPIRGAHVLAALKESRSTTLEWLTTARNHARYANEGGAYDDVLAFLDKHAK